MGSKKYINMWLMKPSKLHNDATNIQCNSISDYYVALFWNMESNILRETIKCTGYGWSLAFGAKNIYFITIVYFIIIFEMRSSYLVYIYIYLKRSIIVVVINNLNVFYNPSVFNKYVNFIWCEVENKSSSFRIMNLIVYYEGP